MTPVIGQPQHENTQPIYQNSNVSSKPTAGKRHWAKISFTQNQLEGPPSIWVNQSRKRKSRRRVKHRKEKGGGRRWGAEEREEGGEERTVCLLMYLNINIIALIGIWYMKGSIFLCLFQRGWGSHPGSQWGSSRAMSHIAFIMPILLASSSTTKSKATNTFSSMLVLCALGCFVLSLYFCSRWMQWFCDVDDVFPLTNKTTKI